MRSENRLKHIQLDVCEKEERPCLLYLIVIFGAILSHHCAALPLMPPPFEQNWLRHIAPLYWEIVSMLHVSCSLNFAYNENWMQLKFCMKRSSNDTYWYNLFMSVCLHFSIVVCTVKAALHNFQYHSKQNRLSIKRSGWHFCPSLDLK